MKTQKEIIEYYITHLKDDDDKKVIIIVYNSHNFYDYFKNTFESYTEYTIKNDCDLYYHILMVLI